MFWRKKGKDANGEVKMFFASDLHGSNVCFKKFVNSAKFYSANVLVLGGDLTGKAVIPIAEQADGTFLAFQHGEQVKINGKDELDEFAGRSRTATATRRTRSPTRSRSCSGSAPATCSCSCRASARSATPPTCCAAACAPTSRCCRCTRGCRRPSSSACSGRTRAAAWCSPPTSPRRRSPSPGIHYVVDPGTARISRYSARLKVQRLPIEPISQASADQRKGRCGRTADGICIRLYDEEDFEARPRFTEPEIQRTSLAVGDPADGCAGLGDVEDFPFLDPPDRRQVRDGDRAAGGARRARRRRAS